MLSLPLSVYYYGAQVMLLALQRRIRCCVAVASGDMARDLDVVPQQSQRVGSLCARGRYSGGKAFRRQLPQLSAIELPAASRAPNTRVLLSLTVSTLYVQSKQWCVSRPRQVRGGLGVCHAGVARGAEVGDGDSGCRTHPRGSVLGRGAHLHDLDTHEETLAVNRSLTCSSRSAQYWVEVWVSSLH